MIETVSKERLDAAEKQADYMRSFLKEVATACGVKNADNWGDGMLVDFLRSSEKSPFTTRQRILLAGLSSDWEGRRGKGLGTCESHTSSRLSDPPSSDRRVA